jgi:hypothetical protein
MLTGAEKREEESEMEFDERYKFLAFYFTGRRIVERFRNLYDKTHEILKAMKVEDSVRIDREAFQNFILDYFTDILRVKMFQNIEHANVNKIYGYEMFWFLRRKPIQTVKEIKSGFDLNEKVALALFTPQFLAEVGLTYATIQNKKLLRDFANLLFYNMKYRIFTQQSFELMIGAFLVGVKCNI